MRFRALTPAARILFPSLAEFDGFYLGGGTALALQIGHRISVDFDLFSNQPIEKQLLNKVKTVFADRTVAPTVNNPEELTVLVAGIKTTFLHYPFPLILPLEKLQTLPALGIEEIAATKAYAIGRRGDYKDYIDLYFILAEQHSNLEKITVLADKKYSSEFNSRLFLEQLVYLEDVSENPIRFLRGAVTKEQLAVFLKQAVGKIKL